MIETHYRLTCDNCQTTFDPPGTARTPHELRLMAAFAAWSCHKRDLCWRCQRYSGDALAGRAIQRQLSWEKIIAALRHHPQGCKRSAFRRPQVCKEASPFHLSDLHRIGVIAKDEHYDPTLRLTSEDQWPTWVRALLCNGGKPAWSDALRAWDDTW